MKHLRKTFVLVALLAVVAMANNAVAATITIVNIDLPGEGFNDPTVVAPVGGNPGTTLGQQRLLAFQYAAARASSESSASADSIAERHMRIA